MSQIKTKYIVDAAITNPKLASMASDTVKANINGSSVPQDAPAVTASTINSFPVRDGNANFAANLISQGVATIATAAGTTTLTVASAPTQQFTGVTTQNLVLPNATALRNGFWYDVINQSTGAVTVKLNDASTLKVVAGSSTIRFTLINNGTSNGAWAFTSSYGDSASAITALTSDVTASGPGSAAATIALNAVTNAKAAQMAARTMKGNNTTATANAADLTIAQIQALLGFQVNYISDPNDSNFEFSIGNWAAYADAAAVVPVDGTGGSPNVTATRSTSSPLSGAASGLITKDAANRQGQGAGLAFTVDSEAKSQKLKIRFSYEASANYTGFAGTEYLVCYVYDVTNTTIIATSNINMPFGSGIQEITFDSTTSTSYRLIFHVAGTGTSAWTYKFDNVYVTAQQALSVPAINDWQVFIPTGSLTTNVTYTGLWKRVGDVGYYEMKASFTGANTQGGLTFNLPSGHTMDTNKMTTASNLDYMLGITELNDSGSTNYFGGLRFSSTTAVQPRIWTDDSGAGTLYIDSQSIDTSTNNPITFGSGDFVLIKFQVPIANWSSNIQLSSSNVEYASNSGMGNAADTTSFINDPNGSPIPAVTYTGPRAKRVRFKNPIQTSDTIELQVKINPAQSTWYTFAATYADVGSTQTIAPWNTGIGYGFGISIVVNSTDVDVTFDQNASAAGTTWNASNTSRWRVVKYSNAIPVESGVVGVNQITLANCNSKGGSSSGETAVVNWGTLVSSNGDALTYTPRTTTAGDKITVNKKGCYAIMATPLTAGSGDVFGITINSSGTSTNPQSLTNTEVPCLNFVPAISRIALLQATVWLNVGDIIRVQGEVATVLTSSVTTRFNVTRIA